MSFHNHTQFQKKIPHQLPYRHLVTLVQIGENWEEIKKILKRTNQIPKDLEKYDEDRLKQRAENVKYWLKNFAPDIVKFEVKKKLPKIKFLEKERKFLTNLKENFETIKWEAENIHKAIYDEAEKQKMQINEAFKIIYQVILEQEKGPRAGYFLSNLDKDFVLNRFEEAVK